jgi:hypothetical protein
MSKKLIDTARATTAKELIEALEDLLGCPSMYDDTTYVTINSDSVKLKLVEETLTDGSKVYNIELSAVTG